LHAEPWFHRLSLAVWDPSNHSGVRAQLYVNA
jgi:hypothetical protein